MGALSSRHMNRTALRVSVLLLLLTCLLLLLRHLSAPALPPTPRRSTPPTSASTTHRPVLTRDLYKPGYARAHPELCPSLGARTQLVILVTSAPVNAEAREGVRLTWGHATRRAGVAFGFIIGAAPELLRDAIDEEDALYGDIIEGHWVDSYSNLSLKTLSILEWSATYCPRAPHLLKVDDDMFVNVPRVLEIAAVPERRSAKDTVWGVVHENVMPVRDPQAKHYAPFDQFPGTVYPPYVDGPAYLMTADAARHLLRVALLQQRYFRLEDVFVTGVLAERCGVRRINYPAFQYSDRWLHPCTMKHIVAIHRVHYNEQLNLWRKLHFNNRNRCGPASESPSYE